MERLGLGAKFEGSVIGMRKQEVKFLISSLWEVEVLRDNKVIDYSLTENVCTTEGIDYLLDVMFGGTVATNPWYICPFEDDYTPLITNVYATPGYTESAAYSEGTRQAYIESAASSRSINNIGNEAVFSINATKTIYGGGLVSVSTKSDAGVGFLYCSSNFGAKPVESGDTLKIRLTISGADI